MEESLQQTYDKAALSYHHQFLRDAEQNRLTKELPYDEFISYLQGKKVLDAGCNSGVDSMCFKELGFDVTGIDISEKALQIACQNDSDNRITFLQMDFRELSFPDNYFDGIWCSAGLVHLSREEIPMVLQNFSRVLKPEGVLFLSLKEGEGCVSRSVRWAGCELLFTLYTKDEIKKLLAKSFFKITVSSWRPENVKWGRNFNVLALRK